MTYSTINPATGETVRTFEDISGVDLDEALRTRNAARVGGVPQHACSDERDPDRDDRALQPAPSHVRRMAQTPRPGPKPSATSAV